MTHAPWYKRNAVIHNELNIEPIREIIKKSAVKFYENIYSIPNPKNFNLPDYDIRENWRRPRATTIIATSLN